MAGKKQPNARNEKVKKQYEKYLEKAGGYDKKTIRKYMNAVLDYESFNCNEDFSRFNDLRAEKFVKYLKSKKRKKDNKPIALYSVYNELEHLQKFFNWLAMQPGYKKSIKYDEIQCIRLTKNEINSMDKPMRDKYPTLDIVLNVLQSIPNNELGMRDRALIAFILVTGGRNASVASLPIECVNIDSLAVDFNTEKGVNTKFKKNYIAYMFNFNPILLDYIRQWYNYLVKEKLFAPQNPLFPKTKVIYNMGKRGFETAGVVPEYWKSDASIENIFRKRFTAAGQEYYPPHSLRHLADFLALSKCRTPEELKAVSQNQGHEHVSTTLSSYAKLSVDRQRELITRMDFSKNFENKTIEQLSTAELSTILAQRLSASGNSF